MAKNQPIELARNVINRIDIEIGKAKSTISLYENGRGSVRVNDLSKEEREIRKSEVESFLFKLEALRDFVIYEA